MEGKIDVCVCPMSFLCIIDISGHILFSILHFSMGVLMRFMASSYYLNRL